MARFLKHTYILPSYWASALVNGDYSGLSDEEAAEVRSCTDWICSRLGRAECVGASEERFARFSDWKPALAGNVREYTFISYVKDYFADDLVNQSSPEDCTRFTVYLRTPTGGPTRVTSLAMPGFGRTAEECLEYWVRLLTRHQEEA